MKFNVLSCLTLSFLLAACVNAPEQEQAQKISAKENAGKQASNAVIERVEQSTPNVIVILTDDQGYSDVSFNGSEDILTPNIDRIAHEGARFDQGYVSFPVCGPSRAGLLTGRYQSRFGYDLNASENPDDPNAGLPLSEKMIAEVLKPAGYTSKIIGKWHMGNHPSFHPLERGFDEFFGFLNGGHNYYADQYRDLDMSSVKTSAQLYQTLLLRDHEKVKTSGYLTDLLSEDAVDFIQRKKDTPFFLYLAYNAPHYPIQAPERYKDSFPHIKDKKRQVYAGMVKAVDDGVGRILDTLDELDLADNTIVFFLSDNGGPLVRAKNGSVNLPLRGGKGDLFEGGVRVPYAIRWPGKIPAGIDYPHPVSSLDILSTIVGVNEMDVSENKPLDGVNLIPYLQDEAFSQMPHDKLFWRYVYDHGNDNWKTAILDGKDKRVTVKEEEMLFDLASDKGEQSNLLEKNPHEAKALEEEFKAWNDEMGELSISLWNEWPKKESGEK